MTRARLGCACAWLAFLVSRSIHAAGEDDASRNQFLLALTADIERVRQIDLELAQMERRDSPREDPRGSTLRTRADALRLRGARAKQSAIGRAIEMFRIDVSRVGFGVIYSAQGNMRDREGATYQDEDGGIRVEIGDSAFASAAWLGATIAHEVEVHVDRQIARGVAYRSTDEQGMWIQELEAYDYELASKDRFGLSELEIQILRARRAGYYRALGWENRKRVDVAYYIKW